MKNCQLCGGKLNDNDNCPVCGEGYENGPCAVCGGRVGDAGFCLQCGRGFEMTDAALDRIVGGMGVASGIGIALSLIRIAQVRRLRRELSRQ